MELDRLARNFLWLVVLNTLLAVAFTAVILNPTFCVAVTPGQFGCRENMVTSWPGTWLFVAYFMFLIAGVLGSAGWAGLYYVGSKLRAKTRVASSLAWLHLGFYEIGVLGATTMMALIGWVGGSVIASGGGVAVSAEAIRVNIIPPLSSDPANVLNDMPPVVEAVFIAIVLLGTLFGIVNYIRAKA